MLPIPKSLPVLFPFLGGRTSRSQQEVTEVKRKTQVKSKGYVGISLSKTAVIQRALIGGEITDLHKAICAICAYHDGNTLESFKEFESASFMNVLNFYCSAFYNSDFFRVFRSS